MKIVFLSNLYPKENEADIRRKMRVDMNDAANALQWNLINGIEEQFDGQMTLVNRLPVYSWPKNYPDCFIKEFYFSHKEGAQDITPGFCNITGVKQYSGKWGFFRHVLKQCAQSNDTVILIYSLQSLFLEAAKKAKKRNPSVRVFAIVADLPEFSSNPKGVVGRIFHGKNKAHIDNLLKYVDGFILLTDQMAQRLHVTVPYIIIEGTIDKRYECIQPESYEDKKTIFYGGSLNKQYGILVLLEAFEKLVGDEYRLVLCGLGDAEQDVRKLCETDRRITFLGKISHSEVLKMQQRATVLVNPRQNNEEFTKFSFPSKTMEYLAAGVPVVAYKLDGIPEEYGNYINYVPNNSADSLADTLKTICELPEEYRRTMGQRGRNFVLTMKNNIKQAEKILNFIR